MQFFFSGGLYFSANFYVVWHKGALKADFRSIVHVIFAKNGLGFSFLLYFFLAVFKCMYTAFLPVYLPAVLNKRIEKYECYDFEKLTQSEYL